MENISADAIQELYAYADDDRKEINMRFFKTGKGEYGEGDVFIGVRVPDVRKVAKRFVDLDFFCLQKLLRSPLHEVRMCALLILVEKFQGSPDSQKESIFQFYLKNTKHVNNWDLVDLSAPKVVGCYLFEKDQSVLFDLASSDRMWDRRIAMVSSYYDIQRKSFETPLKLAKILLRDEHDLMHKAVGWMLREVGKQDRKVLDLFLEQNAKYMARTTLRYAIEKHSVNERKAYLRIKKV